MNNIILHDEKNFISMRNAGKLAAEILDYITEFITPGNTTNYLNDLCHKKIIDNNAIPAPLNYRGFPKSICTSVNHVVCHGIPDNRQLKDGDIINVDVTVILDGWYGDTSRTYLVGNNVSVAAKRITDIAYETMMCGISEVKPGNTTGDIGYAMQHYAESNNCSVVREYTGHGIGTFFHGPPNIYNYGHPKEGITLKEGMFFTIEPMVNLGKHHTKLNHHDGWTVFTKDHSLSAQFEHTIGVTKDGAEIFTLSPKQFTKPPY